MADHLERQKEQHNLLYAAGSRPHFTINDPLVEYVTHWRLKEGFQRLTSASAGRVSSKSKILVMCAGEGAEGSALCDLGYEDVTVSDISDLGVAAAINRDARLKGLVLNAEDADIPDSAFDVVVVQDGLHHLQCPVRGFTEMLRICSVGALFLEPHDSMVGRAIGTKWEKNGEAINYVFRWTKRLVEDVTSSYLGPDSFENRSFSFWHHNIVFHRLGVKLGNGAIGMGAVHLIKSILDTFAGRSGNQFCGLIIKKLGV